MYLQLYTCNKPCSYGTQCYSYSVVTIYATCNVISHVQCSVLYIRTFRSTCAEPTVAVLCTPIIIIFIIIIIITLSPHSGELLTCAVVTAQCCLVHCYPNWARCFQGSKPGFKHRTGGRSGNGPDLTRPARLMTA